MTKHTSKTVSHCRLRAVRPSQGSCLSSTKCANGEPRGEHNQIQLEQFKMNHKDPQGPTCWNTKSRGIPWSGMFFKWLFYSSKPPQQTTTASRQSSRIFPSAKLSTASTSNGEIWVCCTTWKCPAPWVCCVCYQTKWEHLVDHLLQGQAIWSCHVNSPVTKISSGRETEKICGFFWDVTQHVRLSKQINCWFQWSESWPPESILQGRHIPQVACHFDWWHCPPNGPALGLRPSPGSSWNQSWVSNHQTKIVVIKCYQMVISINKLYCISYISYILIYYIKLSSYQVI